MKKRNLVIFTIAILVAGLSFGFYKIFIARDKVSTLTLIEKQWIEDNKNDVIDFGIINDLPVFNLKGNGIIFDFISETEENTGLSFNLLSYEYGDETSAYAFKIKSNIEENDLLLYKDNYVIMSPYQKVYVNYNDISEMSIGVFNGDMDKVSSALSDNKNLSFTQYNTIDDMVLGLEATTNEKSDIDAIAIPKTIYMQTMFENKLYINYQISELKNNYVISLGDNTKLNTILSKYFTKWKKDNYEGLFNKEFTNYYMDQNNISDDAHVDFEAKNYKYGFVKTSPFENIIFDDFVGVNSSVLADFSMLANVEISYEAKYSEIQEVVDAINSNDLDIIFNNNSIREYKTDMYETVSIFDESVVVISHNSRGYIINSINSLNDYDVITVKNSQINKLLSNNNISSEEVKNVNVLLENLNSDKIAVIDELTYNAYKTTYFEEYNIVYRTSLDTEYNYMIRNIEDNEVLIDYFDFYLSFIDGKNFINKIDYTIYEKEGSNGLVKYVVGLLIGLLLLGIAFINKKREKLKKLPSSSVKKEDKLKYIDQLTSLKNRNYLNDSIEKWDESGIYPQAVVIVDLNNVAYINDNHGHAEGDAIIKEAANILFRNQFENSELIRTSGNEFLVYSIGTEEKQIEIYVRKLNKAFKDLSYGFGAVVGYSMITNGIKSVDDAINEATIDMKSKKEAK